jgi:Zn-dependent membrane protease YugP
MEDSEKNVQAELICIETQAGTAIVATQMWLRATLAVIYKSRSQLPTTGAKITRLLLNEHGVNDVTQTEMHPADS